MFARYLKNSIWDFMLLVAMACCFTRTILNGFYTPTYLYDDIALLLLIVASIDFLLLLGAYNKRSAVIAAAAFPAGFVIFISAARAAGSPNVFADSENNPYLYFMLVALTSIGIFLLSRTRGGSIALFVAGAVTLCTIRFLYETGHPVEFLIFILAAGTMYIYRNYRYSVLRSRTIRPVFGRALVTGAVLCLLAIGVGCGLFFGIVRPLDPPTRDLKLITRYMSLPILEKMGVADRAEVLDENLTSDDTNDEEKSAKEGMKEPEGVPSDAEKDPDADTKEKMFPSALDSSRNPFFKVISYLSEKLGRIALLAIAAIAVVAAALIKLFLRRRWLASLANLDNDRQIREMYAYYMKKLRFMKVVKPPEDTLLEFMERARPILGRFGTPGASFRDLTNIYVKSCYGIEPATREEVESYRRFHERFYANCRAYLGNFGYSIRFFGI